MSKILIIDDEKSIRKTLSDILSYEGYKIEEAADGQEARQLLQEQAGAIDIVLANVNAMREKGFELAVWIRNKYPAVEVLLAGTAMTAVEKASDICEEGPQAVPYDHRFILDRIRQLVAARQRAKKEKE